ncbi:L-lysine 6-monooxygenase (NADPH-requiring)-domain-containing protein [Coniella lustricola]|uniref:L-ornithine N(5)-monooxygenase [NAD(P)H] n=1 Tax=Coniella lustricola TaxID=2025994 RepID=A0A2T3A4D2_9PEZI|nr:L-lysine 6-monooxygenase (NADPH-requiring)-domain-containing protein [Coniella lustricola]
MAPHSEVDSHAASNGNGYLNGSATNGSSPAPAQMKNSTPLPSRSSNLKTPEADSVHDLLCVGFGPASLAIAVAIHDSLEAGTLQQAPNVLFLEKQARFAWHAGMLLPGAKMQISFLKDMASLRDPRSHFTFLNYVHKNDRLLDFINLDTFLPARTEYEAYLRWCASHFENVVRYDSEVLSVSPQLDAEGVKTFTVVQRNSQTGDITEHRARNVILAIGGQASIPKPLPAKHARLIHSSQYAYMTPKLLPDRNAPVKVAVIGGGQSAAEIFNNVSNLYPNSKTYLVMKSEFLKPSDDSPFVNSIFNPDFVDRLYPKPAQYRQSLIKEAKATNYGVVRLGLIETLFEMMYDQKREIGHDETQWPHRILGGRQIVAVDETADGKLVLKLQQGVPSDVRLEADGLVEDSPADGPVLDTASEQELLDVDLVIAATGYRRTAHVDMLKEAWGLLPEAQPVAPQEPPRADRWSVQTDAGEKRVLEVSRDYKVKFSKGSVAPGSGIWLQGCCEGTHGLSDTLLSVLSTRSGEMVEAIFGKSA